MNLVMVSQQQSRQQPTMKTNARPRVTLSPIIRSAAKLESSGSTCDRHRQTDRQTDSVGLLHSIQYNRLYNTIHKHIQSDAETDYEISRKARIQRLYM